MLLLKPIALRKYYAVAYMIMDIYQVSDEI